MIKFQIPVKYIKNMGLNGKGSLWVFDVVNLSHDEDTHVFTFFLKEWLI
jgi:hypothetical protein